MTELDTTPVAADLRVGPVCELCLNELSRKRQA